MDPRAHLGRRTIHNALVTVDDPSETYSVEEAAELLETSENTIRRWADKKPGSKGYLANHRLNPDIPGSKRMIHKAAVEALLAKRRKAAADGAGEAVDSGRD